MMPRIRHVLVAAVCLIAVAACSTDRATLTGADTVGAANDPRSAAGRAPTPNSLLDISIALPSTTIRGDGAVSVEISVTNSSNRTVVVPSWQLPAEEVEEALFDVRRNGVIVQYVGPDVKRGLPDASEMVRFASGETRHYTVDLAAAYDLTVDGDYSVAYAFERSLGNTTYLLQSAAASFSLAGRVSKAAPGLASATTGNLTALAATLSYSKCTVTQQSTIATAVQNATTYASNATSYLAVQNSSSQRFQKWFGSPSVTANWDLIKSNFTKIQDAFTTKAIIVDCGCKKNYYAYVYSNQPYKIYVCSYFWKAPMTGTDSKAGTLIHEMSHFTVVAGTGDYAYGQTAAGNLVFSNLTNALRNADNHEYFAENTPVLQ